MEKLYRDDDDMVYDLAHHRYVITEKYIWETYGENLDQFFSESYNPEVDKKVFLDRCSRELYAYIYSYNVFTKPEKEYILALPANREGIKEAMGEFVYTIMMNGTDPNVFYKNSETNYILDDKSDKRNTWIPTYRKNVVESVQLLLDSYQLCYSGKYAWGTVPTRDELTKLKEAEVY